MSWKFKFRSLFSKRLEDDLEDELQYHLEMRAGELRDAGLAPRDAEAEARRRFGNVTLTREQTRESHVFRWLETLWQDAAYALRILSREKAFTLTALLTLALGIGANGAIFSLIEAAILRPLVFPNADQLVVLFGTNPGSQRNSISPADLVDFRKAHSFTSIAAMQGQSVNLTGIDQPSRVIGGFVSPEYFSVLGIPAWMGRTFVTADDEANGARVVVLGFAFWQNQLGGDPAILGRKLMLNGEPTTVVGVMPASFQTPVFVADLWLPSHFYPNYSRDRARTCVLGLGRLAPGVSLAQAQAELTTIATQLQHAYPDSNRERGAVLIAFRDIMTQNLRSTLFALGAAVVCLLLIACANVSGLLVARASARRQELAIRAALGAGTLRITRQLLTESVILSFSGAVLGVGVAYAMARWLSQTLFGWPVGIEVRLNLPVMAFLVVVSIVAGLLFGVGPALFARRAGANALRERGSNRGGSGLRNVLVVAQVAAAFVLLAGAGLLGDSLRRLLAVDPGFRGEHVLTLEYRLPKNKYPVSDQQTQFHNQVLERVRALPGVRSAGIVSGLPFSGNGESTNIGLPDRPAPSANAPFQAFYNSATPGYIETVGIPLRAGRLFRDSDSARAARVMLVNDAFVRRYWPEARGAADVLGRQVLVPAAATIVGVVGSVKQNSLDDSDQPEFYVPYAQDPMIFATLAVKTDGDPMARAKDVQRAVWSIDKDQPMWKIRSLEFLLERSTGGRRLLLELLVVFSSVALLLAALGLYGIISYQVSQRTAEFGVRIAIGARPANVVALVLRQGLVLTGAGLLAGVALLPAAGKVLEHQLFGISAAEPLVYLPLMLMLGLVSLAAAAVPAWRATRIDPVQALRGE
jgi:putative ABC transport system permease protein